MNSDGSVSLAELRDAAASLCPERGSPPKLFGKLSGAEVKNKTLDTFGLQIFLLSVSKLQRGF